MSTIRALIDRSLYGFAPNISATPRSEAPPAPGRDTATRNAEPRTPFSLPSPKLRIEDMIHPRRVLVADDEYLVATSLALSLADLGYSIVGPATDGEQAVSLARRALPDIALLDIRMPKRSGIDAAQEIFRDLSIPVVIVSAFSDDSQVAAATDAGVFGYIVKPASTEQLRAALEVAWGRFAEHISAQRTNTDLQRRLDERRTIERAKWALVEAYSLTETQALDVLRKRARHERRPMIDVALEILHQRGDNS